MHKLLSLLLTAALLLALSACGAPNTDNSGTPAEATPATVFVPKTVSLSSELPGTLVSLCLNGEDLYLSAAQTRETTAESNGFTFTVYETQYQLYRSALGAAWVLPLPNFTPTPLPEGFYGTASLTPLQSAGDGAFWLQETLHYYTYDLPAAFDPNTEYEYDYRTGEEQTTLLRLLDRDGSELRRVELTPLLRELGLDPDDPYLNIDVSFDAEDRLYVCQGNSLDNRVFVLDADLRLLFTLEAQNMDDGIITLADGRKAVRRQADGSPDAAGGYVLSVVDVETQAWGANYALPNSTDPLYDGGSAFTFCYSDGQSLYGWEEEPGAFRKLFNWYDTPLNQSRLGLFTFLENGQLAILTRNTTSTTLALLTETDWADAGLKERKVLVYGTLNFLFIEEEKLIQAFNRSNTDYVIQVRNYLEMNNGYWNNALTQLTTEIQAGQVPDILNGANLPIEALADAGYLEDLWPWIDADPAISRDTLMTEVFDADSRDGKLYRVFPHFSISTVIGAPDIVGEDMGWTMADMLAALEKMPAGASIFNPGRYTKANWLSTLLCMDLDHFVDWDTGECHFDSAEFRAILEFCNTFPQDYSTHYDYGDQYEQSEPRLVARQQMLNKATVSDWDDIQFHKVLFGGDVTYIGYPTADGSVGSAFNIGLMDPNFAMSTTCQDKETVWNFMRQVLLPKYAPSEERQYIYSMFPTNKSDFTFLADYAMTPYYLTDRNGNPILDENGDPVEESTHSGETNGIGTDYYATTQAEYDQIMALYNATHRMYTNDDTLYDIIAEQAAPYFAGDRSLDDTIQQLQSRVKLYVNEKR